MMPKLSNYGIYSQLNTLKGKIYISLLQALFYYVEYKKHNDLISKKYPSFIYIEESSVPKIFDYNVDK